jgi:hypothetical protein
MRGDFLGMPTGKHASWEEVHIGRMANGKVVDWGVVDQLTMLQQRGSCPRLAPNRQRPSLRFRGAGQARGGGIEVQQIDARP